MSDIDERLMKGPEQPKTATAPTATANPGPPYQLGTNFSSLLRGSNFTESIQNLALVIGTAVVHITLGIPISLALVLKNGVFGLLGLASRPRTPNTICVIGASSGIGRSLAIEYATHGKKLLLIARNETRLDEVATECRKLGADVWTRSVDIADPTSPLESTLKEFHDQYQGIDLLIDVAGIVTLTAGTEISGSDYWTTDKAYRPIFESNTLGMIRAALCAADLMRNRPGKLGGQIAWMSSIEAFQGYPTHLFYAGSRAATDTMGKSLRYLLRRDNIFVSTIYPGVIESKMTKAMLHEDKTASFPKFGLKDTRRTAQLIKRGLAKDSAHIAVPFSEYFGAFLQRTFPSLLDELVTAFLGWQSPLGSRLT